MKIIPRNKIRGINGYVARRFDITLGKKEYPSANTYTTFVGVDPGTRNMGLALFHDLTGVAFDIKIPPSPDRVEAMLKVAECLMYLIQDSWPDGFTKGRWMAWVEDAAFGMRFGQVQLAESRAASILYLTNNNIQTIIKPPATIRKAVFGNGRTKAHEVWSILPNAGAAVSCAVYGMLLSD